LHNHLYQAFHDGAGCNTIQGWAWDANSPNSTVSVDIYDGTEFIASTTANMYREDLLNALGSPNHGFSYPTPASLKDGAFHAVNVKFSGTTSPLSNTGRTVVCAAGPNLSGKLDGAGCNAIEGWVWDSNDFSGTVNVDIYNGATLIGTVAATLYRQDLADTLGSPYHGFIFHTPASLKDGQSHVITVKYGGTSTPLPANANPFTFVCSSHTTIYQGSLDVADCSTISGYAWERLTSSTGALSGGAEYDPSHSSVGMNDPGPSGDGTDPGLMYPRNGDPTDLSGDCMIDGGVAPCSSAMSQVNGGAGVATDPYETPSTKWDPQANNGQGGYQEFHTFADGYVGYGPIGARYMGNGRFRSAPVLKRSARSRQSRNPNDVSGGPAWRNQIAWVFFGTLSRECLGALRTAYHANNAAVLRAAQGYAYVKAAATAHGIPAAILTAIGVRETAFRNMQEIGVGHGQGIFQIDDRYHTGAGSVGYDPSAAANYAAGSVADRFTHYTDQGYGGDIAMAAAIHDYNSSAKWTPAASPAEGKISIER
jgi:hypothetical protein